MRRTAQPDQPMSWNLEITALRTSLLLVATAAMEPMVRMGKMEAMAAMAQVYKSSLLSDPTHIQYAAT
jgi:hypothetical protein